MWHVLSEETTVQRYHHPELTRESNYLICHLLGNIQSFRDGPKQAFRRVRSYNE